MRGNSTPFWTPARRVGSRARSGRPFAMEVSQRMPPLSSAWLLLSKYGRRVRFPTYPWSLVERRRPHGRRAFASLGRATRRVIYSVGAAHIRYGRQRCLAVENETPASPQHGKRRRLLARVKRSPFQIAGGGVVFGSTLGPDWGAVAQGPWRASALGPEARRSLIHLCNGDDYNTEQPNPQMPAGVHVHRARDHGSRRATGSLAGLPRQRPEIETALHGLLAATGPSLPEFGLAQIVSWLPG